MFQGNQTLPVWSTNISIAGTRNSVAQILDSGNLVLIQNDTRKALLWQSFAHPTNTWLSFMKLGFNLRTGQVFTSWKSPDDPGRVSSNGFVQGFGSFVAKRHMDWSKVEWYT
ncbi:hypothetical protein V6N13_092667 [Hibiscus sabdariffa]